MFSQAALRVKFASLEESQVSINGVSRYILDNVPSKLEVILSTWEHEFREGDLQSRKRLLYVANDMIQIPSVHQQLIIQKFAKLLELAFWLLCAGGGAKEVERLPSVWRERHIFEEAQIVRFTGILDGTAPQPLQFMEIPHPQTVDETLRPSESNEIVVQSLLGLKKKRDVASTLGEDAVASAHVKIRQLLEQEKGESGTRSKSGSGS